jgi:hypothetical protein
MGWYFLLLDAAYNGPEMTTCEREAYQSIPKTIQLT